MCVKLSKIDSQPELCGNPSTVVAVPDHAFGSYLNRGKANLARCHKAALRVQAKPGKALDDWAATKWPARFVEPCPVWP
jgi:hypothetical protein